MRNIIFIGSTQTSYKRGKDKTKRKSRLLAIAGGAGLISSGVMTGQSIGEKLGERKIASKIYKFKNKVWEERKPNHYRREFRLSKPKVTKLLEKSRKVGGVRGAVIGGGLASASLGAVYLYHKLKDKKKI